MVSDARSKIVSRPLLLIWCAWLLISWALNVDLDMPTRVTPDSMIPLVRGMMLSTLLGLVLMWPAWRLSRRTMIAAGPLVVGDMFSLLLVMQVVVWPLRLLVGWPVARAFVIDVTLIAWTIPIGLWVYLGLRSRGPVGRAWAMLACCATPAAAAIWALVTGRPEVVDFSPMHSLWVLGDPTVIMDLAPPVFQAMIVSGITILAWVILARFTGVAAGQDR